MARIAKQVLQELRQYWKLALFEVFGFGIACFIVTMTLLYGDVRPQYSAMGFAGFVFFLVRWLNKLRVIAMRNP